jgi:predicted CXXCH cytochrome family protein
MMKIRIALPALLAAALLAAAALVALAAGDTGEIAGTVTDAAAGAPVAGARVAVLDRVTVTDAAGRYVLKGIPLSHEIRFRVYRPAPPAHVKAGAKPAATVRKSFVFRDFTETTPFLTAAALGPEGGAHAGGADFRVISPSADRQEVDFILRPLPRDVGPFCRECHPDDEFITSPVTPDEKMSPPEVDETFYRTHRFRDLHPEGMDLYNLRKDKKKKALLQPKVELPLVEGRRVTCDSCHTRHLPTPHGGYMVEEFRTENRLCVKCHA